MTILEDMIAGSRRLSEKSKATYREGVRRFLAFAGPHPSHWTPQAIEAWQSQLSSSRMSNGRFTSPQTINIYTKGVRYASRRWAETQRNPALDFARVVEPLREGPATREIRVLDLRQARRLRQACAGSAPFDLRDAALITCGLRLGLRSASLQTGIIEMLDLKRRVWTVPIKGGSLLPVPLDAETASALARWTNWLRRQGVQTGPVLRSFAKKALGRAPQRVGGRLSPSGVAYAVQKRATAAGLGRLNPHALRHTYVTLARAAGISDDEIAKRTGHRPSLRSGGLSYPTLNQYTAVPTAPLDLPAFEV